jgi:hypothetical protein
VAFKVHLVPLVSKAHQAHRVRQVFKVHLVQPGLLAQLVKPAQQDFKAHPVLLV